MSKTKARVYVYLRHYGKGRNCYCAPIMTLEDAQALYAAFCQAYPRHIMQIKWCNDAGELIREYVFPSEQVVAVEVKPITDEEAEAIMAPKH